MTENVMARIQATHDILEGCAAAGAEMPSWQALDLEVDLLTSGLWWKRLMWSPTVGLDAAKVERLRAAGLVLTENRRIGGEVIPFWRLTDHGLAALRRLRKRMPS